MIHWWKKPLAGDLVWCLFPQDQHLEPGPKPRPGLITEGRRVIGHDEQYAVKVVDGTSQRVDNLFSGEFQITPADGEAYRLAGLSYPTKFDLGKVAELPFNNQWFDVPPQPRHGQNPKLGILHPSLMSRLRAARDALS